MDPILFPWSYCKDDTFYTAFSSYNGGSLGFGVIFEDAMLFLDSKIVYVCLIVHICSEMHFEDWEGCWFYIWGKIEVFGPMSIIWRDLVLSINR